MHTYIIRIICMRKSDIGRLKIQGGGSCMMNTVRSKCVHPNVTLDTSTASTVGRVTGLL